MDYEILSHTKRVAFIHTSDYGVIEIETRGRRDKSALFWVEAALECIKNSSDRIDILRPSKVFIDDKRDYLFIYGDLYILDDDLRLVNVSDNEYYKKRGLEEISKDGLGYTIHPNSEKN